MATMAEFHGSINPGPGQVVVQVANGSHPLPKGAGVVVTSVAKPAGQANGTVTGQVSGTSIVINNPA